MSQFQKEKFDEFWQSAVASCLHAIDYHAAATIWQHGFNSGTEEGKKLEEAAFDRGVNEGRSTQAILELQGRETFLNELRKKYENKD